MVLLMNQADKFFFAHKRTLLKPQRNTNDRKWKEKPAKNAVFFTLICGGFQRANFFATFLSKKEEQYVYS
jgi:hypothetical protein